MGPAKSLNATLMPLLFVNSVLAEVTLNVIEWFAPLAPVLDAVSVSVELGQYQGVLLIIQVGMRDSAWSKKKYAFEPLSRKLPGYEVPENPVVNP